MAQQLSKTGIASLGTIRPGHVSQSIDAFTGIEAYNIFLSGSFNMTGSINGEHGVVNPLTASHAVTASYAVSGGNQNLQQVTNNGNVTNNPIIVQGAVNPALEVTLKTDGTIDLRNGSKTSTLANTNVTNDGVKLEFPNKTTGNYTIATVDDLTVSASIRTSGTTLYSANPATSNFSTTNSIFLGSGSGQNATNANRSNFLGLDSGKNATNSSDSNFLGSAAGQNATNAYDSNFFGWQAGISTSAFYSNFIGRNTGFSATNAYSSNFFGQNTGQVATNANNSNFIGSFAGGFATNANYSNFFGRNTGEFATNANYSNFFGLNTGRGAATASLSTLIGYQVGYVTGSGVTSIGSNNIIIGTNISLPNARIDSINLGGVIFATGSYSTTTGNPYTGSQANARVGIAKDYPNSTLDVAGNTTITGSLIVTGSISGSEGVVNPLTASNAISASYAPDTTFPYTGSAEILGSLTITGSNDVKAKFDNEIDFFSEYNANTPILKLADLIYVNGALNAINPSNLISGSFSGNGNGLIGVVSSSYALSSSLTTTASFALTASHVNPLVQNVIITGSTLITGSLTVSGSGVNIQGNTTTTGSLNVSGSTFFIGTHTLSGSNTITGTTVLSGSIEVSGSSNFHNTTFIVTGSQFFTGSSHFIGSQDITGSLKITGSDEGSGFYIDGNKQFNYASYAHTSSISGSANVSQSFSFNSPDGSTGISLVSGSRITFSHSGVYNIQFSAQLYTQTGATVHIWFKETGSNIPESGTRIGPTANGDYSAPAWNFVKYFPSGSYAELAWQSDQSNTQFQYIAATGNIPSCPAIILTVTQVR